MADIQTAADISAPIIIGIVSSLSVFLFDQPLAVFMTAFGGALWAIWRHEKMKLWQSIAWIIAATITACSMVAFVVWVLHLIGINDAPVAYAVVVNLRIAVLVEPKPLSV